MSWILRAVEDAGLDATIVYPNTDRGHAGVVAAIEAYRSRAKNRSVQVFRSLARDRYLRMLIDADVLVGNSSSGLIEAGTAGTAVVNIGPRQSGREASGKSVVHVAESLSAIRDGLRRALLKRPVIGRPGVYGAGGAGSSVAEVLAKISISANYRHKVITY
jgi:UDP-N-acetylglucosamine 2-epimerase (non-hydrolysing)/GDP/UDP-N,N'-diacetylbacillosamine 2-epimerase (hydrolysing)